MRELRQETGESEAGPGWAGSQPRRRPRRTTAKRLRNVGRTERIASLIAAATLGALASRRRGRLAVLLSIAAGELAYRGLTGHCRVYTALGIRRLPAPH